MSPQPFAGVAVLCGTLVLGGWAGAGLARLDSPNIESEGSHIALDAARVDRLQVLDSRIIDAALPGAGEVLPHAVTASANAPATVQDNLEASVPAIERAAMESVAAVVAEPPAVFPVAQPAASASGSLPDPTHNAVDVAVPSVEPAGTGIVTAALPLATPFALFRSVDGSEPLKPAGRLVELPDECLVIQICVDDYLWSLYERTPKVDMNKVVERIKVQVRKRGKLRTVIKSIAKYVVGDFTWKDPMAAQRATMSLKDYVIGGMDRRFKLKLYVALRAMDEAGFMPGITSAFRDDYRQSIASGKKAASDSSYHGGSRRGGYGHGLAADLVSVKGETRQERFASSIEMWKWIDAHEKELGVGRPYLDRDPPHVGPIDGEEYAAKRGGAKVKLTAGSTPTTR